MYLLQGQKSEYKIFPFRDKLTDGEYLKELSQTIKGEDFNNA